QARPSPSDRPRPVDAGQNPRLEPVSKGGDPVGFPESLAGEPGRDAESDDAGRVLGPRPDLLLLSASGRVGGELDALAHEERPCSLRAMELMRRDRREVHPPRPDIERDPSRRLPRVRVEEDAPLAEGARTPR